LDSVFTPIDVVIFFGLIVFAMVVGLIAGRKEETAEDYFLAGHKVRWWGVAGSIFGSNVSANHMVGMMGIGFSIGFAQSHFELGAIAGLMLLCYGFLPVYRKLNLYTLSEYLEKRYDERSRICYAIIMVIIMAVVHLVPAMYIGSRSICVLMGGNAVQEQVVNAGASRSSAQSSSEGGDKSAQPETRLVVNQNYYALFVIALAVISASYTILGGLKAVVWTDVIQSVLLLIGGIIVAVFTFQAVGGWGEMMALDRAAGDDAKMHLYLPMNHGQLPWTGVFTGLMLMHFFYWGTNQFIVQRALAAQSDKQARVGIIFAGYLKLLIPFFAIAAGVAAVYLFRQQRPGVKIAPDTAFTEVVKLVVPLGFGLVGLIAAGLIGAILSSIDSMMNSAATIVTIDVYKRYWRRDASEKELILVGRVSIGVFVVIAALMAIFILDPNSEKNFFLQIADYQNYLTPGILVTFLLGMFWRRGTALAGFVTILAGILFSWLVVAGYDNYVGLNPTMHALATEQMELDKLSPSDLPPELIKKDPNGNLVMDSNGKFVAKDRDEQELTIAFQRDSLDREIVPFVSRAGIIQYLGPRLNFFHRVVVVMFLCVIAYVLISLFGQPNPEKSRLTWTDMGGHDAGTLQAVVLALLVSIAVYAVIGLAMYRGHLRPVSAAWLGAVWTMLMYGGGIAISLLKRRHERSKSGQKVLETLLTDDRLWAGILCSLAVFMLYYFY
jgi:SSS family solute:Na+ symporter